ncbi:MAG TPA: DUF2207 domain-containing protein [Rhizomicrobium sp.]|jgi:uncharacterized membrane protein YgcG|nr:DUF2207 domain-containing protein [Rhizomicrobium sp.]
MLRGGVFALLLALVLLPAAAQESNESRHSGADTPHPATDTNEGPPSSFSDPSDTSERITGFNSDIVVARNGALTVTETIAVYATGDQIHHGIYRDFPTIYDDLHGQTVHVRFDVVSVTMDGHSEAYATESLNNGVRVKIGDADTIVDPGNHTYVLSYITARQIGFFEKYDELYWNVTGNGWIFPIDRASATIHLPKGAKILQSAFYTGTQGADGHLAISDRPSSDSIHFVTTNRLSANEGLTVAVGFAKGLIAPPSAEELRRNFIVDNAAAIVAVLGALALTIFYLATWWQYGRDPKRGTIIPLFSAPAGLSPEAVRYIHKMAYDRKAFAAALINMAVKGAITIQEDGGTYTLVRTPKNVRDCGLSASEIGLSDALFVGEATSIELRSTNAATVQRAITSLKNTLKNECEKHYFVTNAGWFWAGMGILALTGIASAMLGDRSDQSGVLLVFAGMFSMATAWLLHICWGAWVSVFRGPGSWYGNLLGAVFATVIAVPFTVCLIGALIYFGLTVSTWPLAVLILGGIMAYVFYHLLKAPTAAGAVVMDQIDGFKLFLETAEKDRLEMLNPPNVTPEVFEKFLPYAIALDCENQWSKKFEAEAAAAAAGAGTTPYVYAPLWYSGSNFGNLGTAGLVSSIGSSIGSAVASASVPPGSSSGSGGGGFSGGGGGGGGGGGW